MAEIRKLSEREKVLRQEILDGTITSDDSRWINNRKVSHVYAREGKLKPV